MKENKKIVSLKSIDEDSSSIWQTIARLHCAEVHRSDGFLCVAKIHEQNLVAMTDVEMLGIVFSL